MVYPPLGSSSFQGGVGGCNTHSSGHLFGKPSSWSLAGSFVLYLDQHEGLACSLAVWHSQSLRFFILVTRVLLLPSRTGSSLPFQMKGLLPRHRVLACNCLAGKGKFVSNCLLIEIGWKLALGGSFLEAWLLRAWVKYQFIIFLVSTWFLVVLVGAWSAIAWKKAHSHYYWWRVPSSLL